MSNGWGQEHFKYMHRCQAAICFVSEFGQAEAFAPKGRSVF